MKITGLSGAFYGWNLVWCPPECVTVVIIVMSQLRVAACQSANNA